MKLNILFKSSLAKRAFGMNTVLFLFAFAISSSSIFANTSNEITTNVEQQISVTVTSEDGEVLIGASVIVKGTSIGTDTDFDGKFSLSIPDDATTLIVSYIEF